MASYHMKCWKLRIAHGIELAFFFITKNYFQLCWTKGKFESLFNFKGGAAVRWPKLSYISRNLHSKWWKYNHPTYLEGTWMLRQPSSHPFTPLFASLGDTISPTRTLNVIYLYKGKHDQAASTWTIHCMQLDIFTPTSPSDGPGSLQEPNHLLAFQFYQQTAYKPLQTDNTNKKSHDHCCTSKVSRSPQQLDAI